MKASALQQLQAMAHCGRPWVTEPAQLALLAWSQNPQDFQTHMQQLCDAVNQDSRQDHAVTADLLKTALLNLAVLKSELT